MKEFRGKLRKVGGKGSISHRLYLGQSHVIWILVCFLYTFIQYPFVKHPLSTRNYSLCGAYRDE